MCGKDLFLRQYYPMSLGSPPHVRERLRIAFANINQFGITPACAGKTNILKAYNPRK